MSKLPRHLRVLLPLAVLAVFVARVWAWASAEIWYDEAITLVNFVGGWGQRSLLEVFRDYSLANNHFLCTAIYWCWLKVVNVDKASELLLRLPSLLAGALTVLLVLQTWRQHLGRKYAFLAALLLACGPIYPAFAYQIRGYIFSLLLSVISTTACVFCAEKSTWRNQSCLVICALLQPLLMPSAALLAPVLALSLALTRKLTGHGWRDSLLPTLPMLVATALGLAYYATLGEQLAAAAADATSIAADIWTFPSLVGHLLSASALQFAVPLVLLCGLVLFNRLTSPNQMTCVQSTLWLPLSFLLVSALGTGAALLLAKFAHSLPFPRNFLLLLPPLTFALFSLLRQSPNSARLKLLPLSIAILLWGWLLGAWGERQAASGLANGENPQNLLCQYYRGETSNRDMVAWFAREKLLDRSILLVSTLDGPTVAWYWRRAGGPDDAVCDRFAPVNSPETELADRLAKAPFAVRFCSARNQIEADFYRNCLQKRVILPLEQPSLAHRKVYRAL